MDEKNLFKRKHAQQTRRISKSLNQGVEENSLLLIRGHGLTRMHSEMNLKRMMPNENILPEGATGGVL